MYTYTHICIHINVYIYLYVYICIHILGHLMLRKKNKNKTISYGGVQRILLYLLPDGSCEFCT